MRKIICFIAFLIALQMGYFSLEAIGSTTPTAAKNTIEQEEPEIMSEQKLLGGISPAEALDYMKAHPDLVIVQVNTAVWKIEPGFTGALWIPHDEMDKRYNEIPTGKPVLLHCGAGVVSVPAYKTLIEKRPDIPELGYIAGSPHSIMAEYNKWLASSK